MKQANGAIRIGNLGIKRVLLNIKQSFLFSELGQFLPKLVKSFAESTRAFVRWMDGTCIETPPQFVSEDEDPVVFSFLSDLT